MFPLILAASIVGGTTKVSPPLLLSPFAIVLVSVVFIAVAIGWLRVHAFLALMVAAMLVALLSAVAAGDGNLAKAVEKACAEFGATAGKVGLTIACAAIIGVALMESGAADKIVRQLVLIVGETRAGIALLLCSFILAAPVFVDTVFMLMLPLARALSLRTGRDFLLYVLMIGCGGVITNGIVPPAPGPLLVAETLKIQLGHAILTGVVFGLPPMFVGYFIGKWFNRRFTFPVRPVAGVIGAASVQEETDLPGFWISLTPVVLPLMLTAAAAYVAVLGSRVSPGVANTIQFLGNKNVALSLGAIIALALLIQRKHLGWRTTGKIVSAPLETAGIIILIVSAGGAYGAMIKNTGLGEQMRGLTGGHLVNPVLAAWTITALIRAALGSATVATITGVGIMASIAGDAGFGVDPLYILLAIGFGSKCFPWMNDAGFWVVSRLSGLTQGEMLRTWSPALSLLSVAGLVEVLIASAIWPRLPL